MGKTSTAQFSLSLPNNWSGQYLVHNDVVVSVQRSGAFLYSVYTVKIGQDTLSILYIGVQGSRGKGGGDTIMAKQRRAKSLL